MLLLPVFFGLISSTAAVDLYLRFYKGADLICVGLDPETCCGVSGFKSDPFWSMDFQVIPADWNLRLRGHAGPLCGNVVDTTTTRGATSLVLTHGPFTGGGYSFAPAGTKRSESEGDYNSTLTKVARPNLVTLSDGVQYNLRDLDDASFAEMVRALPPFQRI